MGKETLSVSKLLSAEFLDASVMALETLWKEGVFLWPDLGTCSWWLRHIVSSWERRYCLNRMINSSTTSVGVQMGSCTGKRVEWRPRILYIFAPEGTWPCFLDKISKYSQQAGQQSFETATSFGINLFNSSRRSSSTKNVLPHQKIGMQLQGLPRQPRNAYCNT